LKLQDRLARAAGLLRRHGPILPEAFWLLAAVTVQLRRQGYGSTRDWLDQRSTDLGRAGSDEKSPSIDDRIEFARELAFIVRLAARVIPDATCLRKGLVLQHLLTGRGVPASIRFGAMKALSEPTLSFHAWVEVDGQVVSEEPQAVAPYALLMDEPPRTGD